MAKQSDPEHDAALLQLRRIRSWCRRAHAYASYALTVLGIYTRCGPKIFWIKIDLFRRLYSLCQRVHAHALYAFAKSALHIRCALKVCWIKTRAALARTYARL